MVGRYVKITAQPGQGVALAELMLDVARSLRGTDGCELYVINRAVDEADVVWVTEIWRDQAAIDASLQVLQTDAGKAQMGEVMALVAGPPQRTDLEPLGGIGLRD
jgi:quinol monooxygenase YgiN